MRIEREELLSLARTLVVAGCALAFFMVLSIFPDFSFVGEASTRVEDAEPSGFLWVRAYANITYNPFLYTFSWLSGQGIYSGNFLFLSKPPYNVYGPRLLDDEAVHYAVVGQLRINATFNFVLLLLLGLLGAHDLYVCMIVGAVGFPIGGVLGAFAGFIVAVAVVSYVKRRHGAGVLESGWNSLQDKVEENWVNG